MSAAPHLRVVNADGEIVHDDRDILIEQLQAELKGKSLTIGKMKRELAQLRMVEPEAELVREILDYWRERCRPRATIAPGGKRWEKVRARLKDRLDDRDPWTPEELKLAVDGALLDPWLSGRAQGSKGYLDAETIFRDSEMVERLKDLAVGFAAQASVPLGDLLDVADQLPFIDWKHMLRVCLCGHRRFEHSLGDPNQEGREACLRDCACIDFTLDSCNQFNLRVDSFLQRWYGDEKSASA